MRKKILVGCLWSLLALSAWGQRGIEVIEASTGDPLPGATVLFRAGEATAGGFADSLGRVWCDLKGKVQAEIRLMNYLEQRVDLKAMGLTRVVLSRAEVWLDDVVVTAQLALGSSDESVHAIRVIDKERISAQGAVSLRDVLRQDLNVRLQQDQVLGTGLTMNGLSGQQVKILVDGVPVVGRQNGNLDLGQLLLGDVERIEVVEGPLSVNYGTDALGGTINIITQKQVVENVRGRVSAYWESVGQYNAEGSVGISKGKNQLTLGGGRNFFAGFSEVDTSRFKDWKPREQYFGNWELTRTLPNWRLGVGGRYFDELITNRGLLRGPYFETAFDDYYHTTRIDHHFTAQGNWGQNWTVDIVAAVNLFDRDRRSTVKDLTNLTEIERGAENQDTTKFQQWMSRGTFNRTLSSGKLAFQLGYDISWNENKGQRIDQRSRGIFDAAGFGSVQFQPAPRFKLQAGARWGYNSGFPPPVTPALNLWYKTPGDWIVRGAYARGFRSPTIKELYLFFVDINHNIRGNQDLRAEYSHHFSVSVDKTHLSENGQVWKLMGKAWYNQLEDQIALSSVDASTNLFTYQNIEEFRGLGGQVTGGFETERFDLNLGFSANGTAYELGNDEPPTLRWAPESNLQAGWNWSATGLRLALFYKLTGRRVFLFQNASGETEEGFQQGFNTLDLTLARSFFKDKMRLQVGGKNLFDVVDVQTGGGAGGVHSGGSSSMPINWGRTVFAQINWEFK